MAKPEQQADRHEQGGAQPVSLQPPQPQPQREGEHRQRHRQRIVDEAEMERVAIGQRQCEESARRHAAMDFVRDPQEAGRSHHRDRDRNRLNRRLQPEQRRQALHQQIDAEIADQRPLEPVPLLQHRRGREVQLHLVPAHVAGKIDQRRDLRQQERDRHRHGDGDQRPPVVPPRRRRKRGVRPHPSPRRPSKRKRSAFNLMKPCASR
jgi:hypothetical protein